MSQRKKGSASKINTADKLDIFPESESQAEPHLSLNVIAGNQLIGQLLPEFSRKQESVKPKSRPPSSQRQNSAYAMVIPTGSNEVSESWEGKILPKVPAHPEETNSEEYTSPQIPPAPPSTARDTSLLKVILKGKTAPKVSGSAFHPVEKASKMPGFMMEELKQPTAPPVTRTGTEIYDIFTSAAPVPATLPLKPALLPCVGNVKSLALNEKKKKMTKYKVTLKKPKNILGPIMPETKTETMEMEIEPQEIVSESMQEKRMQSSEMEEAQSAVRMLVQEAKVLSEEEIRPSSVKTKTKKKESPIESTEEMEAGCAPRSVDEIIDSLWEQVHSDRISDSDRRIQEIMNRVMSRGMVHKTEKLQENVGDEEASDISDKSTQKQDMEEEEEEEEEEEKDGGTETFVPQDDEDEPEEMIVTETEPTISEEDDVCITAEAGPWDIDSFVGDGDDLSKLKAILDLPLHVSREDILSLRGQPIKRFSQISLSTLSKSPRKSKTEMSFLSSWKNGDIIIGGGKSDEASTANQPFQHHHFCTIGSEFQTQPPFTHVGWGYHTPNRFIKNFPIQECRQSILNEMKRLEEMDDSEKYAEAADNYSDILDEWVEQAEVMFTDIELMVKGNRVPTILTNNMHFWTLSPPKLHVLPGIITQMVCPNYHGSFQPGHYTPFDQQKSLQTKTAAELLSDATIEKNEQETEELLKIRLLQQKCKSSLGKYSLEKWRTPDLKGILLHKQLRSNSLENLPIRRLRRSESVTTIPQVEKPQVLPSCKTKRRDSSFLALPSDFDSLITEMREHKKHIHKMEKRKKDNLLSCSTKSEHSTDIYNEDVNSLTATAKLETSEKDGREKRLSRGLSITSTEGLSEKSGSRSSSVAKGLGIKSSDEKLAALPKACRDLVAEWKSEKTSTKDLEEDLSTYKKKNIAEGSNLQSDILPYNENKIDISEDDHETLELNKKIWSEIGLLTKKMRKYPHNWIFNTCRRGILYRKVGEINKSFEDLDKVIAAEPGYLDAYWHRHFLYVLRGDYSSALKDLNFVHGRKPAYKVYMALGVLHETLHNTHLALANYTKAIYFDSSNYLAYYYRAKLYETSGNANHAIGDFINTSERNPTHTEALKKQAEYFLSVKNYNVAISKLYRILQHVLDPEAFVLRAEAYIGLKLWTEALGDVSTAIHLCPSLWKAFYLRGCLLKNDVHLIDKAVMDLSISLLLNDSIENKCSFHQRGIIYISKKCPEQAAADFSSILEFEPNNIDALLNLGLINLKNFHNYSVAIIFFSKVISLDPINIKAYQFRGQSYTKIFQFQSALRDYTRIIHIEPNNYMYYFFLGEIFLKMKKNDIASFFIKIVANAGSNVNFQTSSELAAVHASLKNFDKAISILQKSLEKNPEDPQLLMSLGVIQLESNDYQQSLNTFNALRKIMMSQKKKNKKWPSNADEVFYKLGMIYLELKQEKKALAAFNQSIDINPRHAQCLYYRGLVKIYLNYPQCVIDFNKALAVQPRYFEVYMSRAAYFAMKKNYTKAILNCNEALKIHKNSVRALLYRGSIKYFISAYQLAVVDLTKAIALKGNFALAFFNRAICHEALEEYGKALCDYSVVLMVTDNLDFNVFINRGSLYYQLEDFENAKEDFREALRLKPQDHKIIHAWGLCLHKLGRLDDAKEMFTHCIRTNCRFSDAYISRGNVYMDYVQEKETLLACYDYQRAINIKPDDVLARICLGYSLQVSGKFQKAWHQFSEGFIIDPSNESTLEGRASVCLQMGSTYAAFQDLNAAIRINPTAELYNNRGVVNQYMKCLRDAITDYKHAIELDPEYALAYYNAANVHLHGRFFKQALTYFDKAINLDPTDECAFINRAVTKVMLKDFEGASSDFGQAHQMCPYYAHIYFNRGNLYASLRLYTLAEKDFTAALDILPDDPLTLVQRANIRGKMGLKDLAIEDYKRAMKLKENV